MNRGVLLLLIVVISMLLASLVSAQTCTLDVKSKNTDALIKELPAIDASLKSCPVNLGSPLNKVFKNDVVQVKLKEGQIISATINGGKLASMTEGAATGTTFIVTMSKCNMDAILSNSNPIGVFAYFYINGQATMSANGFWNKIRLGFMKTVMKSAFKKIQVPVTTCDKTTTTTTTQAGSGKPSNCYETYMEGHREYQYGKKTWDQWKAETRGVCQTQTAERPKGDCVHLFEQIAGNDKKWLCWYN